MDHFQAKLNSLGQLHSESMSDTKSRFWQISNQPFSRTEVLCPQPRRATGRPCALDGFQRPDPRPKGIQLTGRGDCGLEILDMILSKDDSEGDLDGGNQPSFFCGSPPVRTNNPVVQDAQFIKQTHFPASPLSNIHGIKLRAERGSPSCGSSVGGSPKMRIEGFALA